MLHPSQSGPCSTLSSDLESSCSAAWLLSLSGKTSLQLLGEAFFPFPLLVSSRVTMLFLFLPLAPLWSGLHLAPCTGCLPALRGRPRGGFSPGWVLCHLREIWGAAGERDSTGLWSLLSPGVTHKSCLLAMVLPAQLFCWAVVSQAGVLQWITFEHVIALSSSNKSGWTMKAKW